MSGRTEIDLDGTMRVDGKIVDQRRGPSELSASGCSARYLEVEARVRYWEDAYVNGVEDVNGNLIPLKDGKAWKPVIELATGRVMDWPEGTTADVHYKVCDAGDYWLLDENRNRLKRWGSHYVPDRFLCVGDEGYGDYIILKIDAEGMIEGWKEPAIDLDGWVNI